MTSFDSPARAQPLPGQPHCLPHPSLLGLQLSDTSCCHLNTDRPLPSAQPLWQLPGVTRTVITLRTAITSLAALEVSTGPSYFHSCRSRSFLPTPETSGGNSLVLSLWATCSSLCSGTAHYPNLLKRMCPSERIGKPTLPPNADPLLTPHPQPFTGRM